jgi:magnesium-transporting ATPase (P-type)
MEEGLLTGESKVRGKHLEALEKDIDQTAKANMVFSGTLVSKGKGIGVVVATGMSSQMGKISEEMEQAAKESEDTPLKKKIKEFGDQLAWAIFILCGLIWGVNFHNFFDPAYSSPWIGALCYFKIAVALAVAAIPEGLPAVITTCLALGTR